MLRKTEGFQVSLSYRKKRYDSFQNNSKLVVLDIDVLMRRYPYVGTKQATSHQSKGCTL